MAPNPTDRPRLSTSILATEPLRRTLALERAAPDGGAAGHELLAAWYATAVRLEGGPAVLFLDRTTLLEVVVPAGPLARVEKAFARRAVALLRRLGAGRAQRHRVTKRLARVRWWRACARNAEERSLLASTGAAARRLRRDVGALAPGFGRTATRFELAEAARPRAALGGQTPRRGLK